MAKNNTIDKCSSNSCEDTTLIDSVSGFLPTVKKNLISFLLFILTSYQRYISPLFAPHCRFYPSCSEYAKQAISTHGFWRGSAMTGYRLLRCNPLFEGGSDPVPPACSHRNH